MEAYFEHARSDIEHNMLRARLVESDLMTDRTCMSTLYRSKTAPGHYALVYFTPTPTGKTNSISKGLILVPVSLCSLYSFSKRKYCSSCIKELKETKRCPRCPLQQYCIKCTKELHCPKCVEDKWCSSCTVRLRKWTNYRLSLQHCKECPTEGTYCEECVPLREQHSCQVCPRDAQGNLLDKSCKPCREKLKCENCPEGSFCEECSKIRKFTPCASCPPPQFCRKCLPEESTETCKTCPPLPEIIERCVIISQMPLSVDAKSSATTNIPRIKPSTGEYLEVGCLIQTFLDWEILYNKSLLLKKLFASLKIKTITLMKPRCTTWILKDASASI